MQFNQFRVCFVCFVDVAWLDAQHTAVKLAKPRALVGAQLSTDLLLRKFAGEPSVLTQLASLEKKVFAKRASWTGSNAFVYRHSRELFSCRRVATGILEKEVRRRNTRLFYVTSGTSVQVDCVATCLLRRIVLCRRKQCHLPGAGCGLCHIHFHSACSAAHQVRSTSKL